MISRRQKGFTIVELMIATLIFSIILLLAMSSLIQVGRSYYQGVVKNQTQEAARSVVQSVSEAIQFSGGPIATTITPNGATKGFCVDTKRFSFIPNKKLSDSPKPNETLHAMVVDTISGCSSDTLAQDLTTNVNLKGRELLSPNMRIIVSDFGSGTGPTFVTGSSNLWTIGITVIYGDDDLINGGQCIALRVGGQFCAVSSLVSTVGKRLQ